MRLTTRFAATLLTAGALLAPATMPAAQAVTVPAPSFVVADLGDSFAPPLGVVKSGTRLAVINLRPDLQRATYTLTSPFSVPQTLTLDRAETGQFDLSGQVEDLPDLPDLPDVSLKTYTLETDSISGGTHMATFVAL